MPPGQLDSRMVAEEVPLVICSLAGVGIPPPSRHRVGVKRSREQTHRRFAAAVPVRPALDADPAGPVRRPTMDDEERGAASTTRSSSWSPPLPARPPFLLQAGLAGAAPNAPRAHRTLMHGLLSGAPRAHPAGYRALRDSSSIVRGKGQSFTVNATTSLPLLIGFVCLCNRDERARITVCG